MVSLQRRAAAAGIEPPAAASGAGGALPASAPAAARVAAAGIDLPALAALVRAYGTVVRAVIAEARGSTPREAGAAMMVWQPSGRRCAAGGVGPAGAPTCASGATASAPPHDFAPEAGQTGTIGGGALEWEVAAAARRLEPAPWARRLLRLPLGPALGQCCGGRVTVLLERFGPMEVSWLEDHRLDPFVRSVAAGVPPDSRPAAAGSGRRAGGFGSAIRLHRGQLIEPLATPALPLWLYGAGHVGRAIVAAAAGLPLAITWVDVAAERFPAVVPSHALRLVAADPARAVPHAPDEAVHLVLSHSHAIDLAICHAVLLRRHSHLGLIGSGSKKARFLARLAAAGVPEAALARLHCPIGDPSLGKLPAAIAIGVVADLLRLIAAANPSPAPA